MLKEILSSPTQSVSKAGRFVIFQIKLWTHCARLLKKNRAGQQAAALAYHTIFGIVPLAIVMLLIFNSFPAYSDVGDKVKGLVYEQMHLSTIEYPDPANPEQNIKLTEYFDNIINRFFEGLNEGTIALFSAVIIIWAALALLSTTEKAFNNIWHISRGRNILHRIINYWALLTLGPLILGLGIYASTQFVILSQLQETVMTNIAPDVLSFIIATVLFLFLYFVLPNTRVQVKAALWGAAVAAFVWTLAKLMFGLYVTKFIPYSQIYGVMGLIPLGVLWIYISWLTVLFGLQLTFTTQHLKNLDAAEIATAAKAEEHFIANDFTVINIVREIAEGFEKNNAPVEAEVISSKLDVPVDFCDKILEYLVSSKIVIKSSEPKTGFLPAQDPENIKLSDIAKVVEKAGFGHHVTDQSLTLNQITQAQQDALSQYNLKQILDIEQTNQREQ